LRGRAAPLLFNFYELLFADGRLNAARNFIAGIDIEPPETHAIPFSDADFDSAEHRAFITEPWRVSDENGRVLPMWHASTTLYRARGRLNNATPLAATPSSRVPLPESHATARVSAAAPLALAGNGFSGQ
jgi:hypothetical protein